MPLLDFWKSNPDAVSGMSIVQIVATAGDGNLRDGSVCCEELRTYLQQVTLGTLEAYADYCLTTAFPHGGRVLQDIVNELGRRLDNDVIDGLYQGVANKVGFDGVWKSPEDHALVVEVKTTDAYRIKLQTLAEYRRKLVEQGTLERTSSILIVVGREDTGELEAQIRGSRHAWDIRLISVDALLSLVKIKQDTEDPVTAEKIRKLLVPFDYTRLDDIIEVMFATATDLESAVEEPTEATDVGDTKVEEVRAVATDPAAIGAKRDQLIKLVGAKLGVGLIKKTRATYWDTTHDIRVACSISKPYTGSIYRYWYAYHPTWDDFLAHGKAGYIAWGGTDIDLAFVFPRSEFHSLLPGMITTVRPNGKTYWHVKIIEQSPHRYLLHLPHKDQDLPLERYQLR